MIKIKAISEEFYSIKINDSIRIETVFEKFIKKAYPQYLYNGIGFYNYDLDRYISFSKITGVFNGTLKMYDYQVADNKLYDMFNKGTNTFYLNLKYKNGDNIRNRISNGLNTVKFSYQGNIYNINVFGIDSINDIENNLLEQINTANVTHRINIENLNINKDDLFIEYFDDADKIYNINGYIE